METKRIQAGSLVDLLGLSEEKILVIHENSQKIISQYFDSLRRGESPNISEMLIEMIFDCRKRNFGEVSSKLSGYEKELFLTGIAYQLIFSSITEMLNSFNSQR